MKKVFNSNSQLCHAWANKLQDYGKGSSMFFEGPVIYSYGHHYEIARFVDAPNGEKVVFVNSNGYSKTTAKHTSHVFNSIPDGIKVFEIPFIKGSTWNGSQNYFNIKFLPNILELMLKNVQNLLDEQLKARSTFYKFYEASEIYSNICEISKLFNLSEPKRPNNWLDAQIKSNDLRNTQQERQEKKQAKELEKSFELLAKWLCHEYNGQLYNLPIHLRISKDGKLIETTKGAKVQLSEALQLVNKIKNGENVLGYKIDGFTVIDTNQDQIKIGCHTMSWNIINNFLQTI